jgi:hypothetical protein
MHCHLISQLPCNRIHTYHLFCEIQSCCHTSSCNFVLLVMENIKTWLPLVTKKKHE